MDISSNSLSSSEKRKLLEKLLTKRHVTKLPLTFAQQRMWYLEQKCTSVPVNILSSVFRLRGELDLEALRRALDYLVERQEALRVTFSVDEQQVWQVISPERQASLSVYELESLPVEERETYARSLIDRELETPFDLHLGPLFRALLLVLSPREHLLVFNIHNLIADGWSLGILYRDFSQIYTAIVEGQSSPLSPLPLQYTEFVQALHQEFQGERKERECAYWRQKFQGLSPQIKLPPPVKIYSRDSQDYGVIEFSFSADEVNGLRTLARSQGVTFFMSLVAVFSAYLHLYLQEERLVIATPVANRHSTTSENLIGYFVNVLVLDVDLRGAPTFRTLLERIKAEAKDCYAHPQLPFNELLADLPFPDRNARNPLAHFMLAYHGFTIEPLKLPKLEIEQVEHIHKIDLSDNPYEMDIHFWDNSKTSLSSQKQAGCLSGSLLYCDRFDSSTVAQIIVEFQSLVRHLISSPDLPIAAFPIADKHHL